MVFWSIVIGLFVVALLLVGWRERRRGGTSRGVDAGRADAKPDLYSTEGGSGATGVSGGARGGIRAGGWFN